MAQLHFSMVINAPREKVWEVMLGEETYREWTEVFNPEGGSHYEGSWDEGEEIRFIGPDEQGRQRGMYSRIAKNKPYEFISIEHLGEIEDGKEVPSPTFAGAHENYTFTDKHGATLLEVDLESNMPDEYAKMFQDMWPQALAKLKQLAEKPPAA